MSSSDPSYATPTRLAHRAPLPPVDERLVMPESRYEAIDGKITYVCPSDETHGTYHSRVAALLEAYVVATHNAAVDMLTRTSAKNDMAPDVSIYPAERDEDTGGRKLEELAFEVVSTETLAHAGKKARRLVARGVRRVFAIDVERKKVLEWSRSTDAWEILAQDASIADPTLVIPLPLSALAVAMKADDDVARALLAKKNAVIEAALNTAKDEGKADGVREGKAEGLREGKAEGLREGKAEGLREGKAEGLREGKADGLREGKADGLREGKAEAVKGLRKALLRFFAHEGLALTDDERARVLECSDVGLLNEWIDHVLGADTAAQVLSHEPAGP